MSATPIFHDEQGHLKMNFNATVEIITTKDIKICGALGPCSSLKKKKKNYICK
jgi:protein transport protein SEC23